MTRSRCITLTALIALALAMWPGRLESAAGVIADQVEEDWEVIVNTPDQAAVGPQLTTTMSPTGTNRIPFVAFNLNYRDNPFQAGGLQLQVWNPTVVLDSDSHSTAVLNTPGETITWTQRMRIEGGSLFYEVRHGHSQTWGDFGGESQLAVHITSTLTDLSAYDPDVSASNSGAGWMGNRVTSMTLKQVRYYTNGSLIQTDTHPRDCSLTP